MRVRFKDEKGRIAWLTFLVGLGLMGGWYVLRSFGDIFVWLGSAYSFIVNLLMPFILAVLLAYLFAPVVNAIHRLLLLFRKDRKKPAGRISRLIAVIAFIILFFGLLGLGSVFLFPALARNIADIVRYMPGWIVEMRNWLTGLIEDYPMLQNINIDDTIQNALNGLFRIVADWARAPQYLFSLGKVFGNGMIQVGMGFVVLFFILYDPQSIIAEFARLTRAFTTEKRFLAISDSMRKINQILNNYLRGRLVESALLGVLTLIGLAIVQSRFSVAIAVMVGLLNLVPYVGSMFSFVVAILLTLLDAPSLVLAVGIVLIAAQIVDNALLIPLIIGDSIGLSPFWVILATAVFGKLLGIIGMLLAPPIMAIIFMFVEDYVQRQGDPPISQAGKAAGLLRQKKKRTG